MRLSESNYIVNLLPNRALFRLLFLCKERRQNSQ